MNNTIQILSHDEVCERVDLQTQPFSKYEKMLKDSKEAEPTIMTYTAEQLSKHGADTFFAVFNGDIIGAAIRKKTTMSPFDTIKPSAQMQNHKEEDYTIGELTSVIVCQENQAHGVGSALVDHIVKNSEGYDGIMFATLNPNMARLGSKQGFEEVPFPVSEKERGRKFFVGQSLLSDEQFEQNAACYMHFLNQQQGFRNDLLEALNHQDVGAPA